jgi:predicted DNA-binding transcriptional regulator AlpA
METWLSFDDLKGRGIVKTRMTLSRWIRTQGFPPGKLIGPNSRRYPLSEVVAWLESRPGNDGARDAAA